MSYFSILNPSGTASVLRIRALHINVWSLPGLLGHRPMIIDVGVMFSATNDQMPDALEIVIPARVVKQIDLSREVLDSKNARLIFARHFQSSDNHALQLREYGTVRVIPAETIEHEERLVRLTQEPSRELTALRVKLAEVPACGTAYTRVRFVIDHAESLWRWNRVLGRRSGAIIDLRVHDPREGGAGADAPAGIHERDLSIENLEAFFMLPEHFYLGGQNPPLTYTRTLEGRRWRHYLRRGASGPLRHEAMLVHRWSKSGSDAEPAVSAQRPFRGYLQFERVPSLRATSDLVLAALAVVALAYAVFAHANLRSGVVDAGNWIGSAATFVYYAFAAALTLLGILALLGWAGKTPGIVRKIKRMLKKLEYWWFKALGR